MILESRNCSRACTTYIAKKEEMPFRTDPKTSRTKDPWVRTKSRRISSSVWAYLGTPALSLCFLLGLSWDTCFNPYAQIHKKDRRLVGSMWYLEPKWLRWTYVSAPTYPRQNKPLKQYILVRVPTPESVGFNPWKTTAYHREEESRFLLDNVESEASVSRLLQGVLDNAEAKKLRSQPVENDSIPPWSEIETRDQKKKGHRRPQAMPAVDDAP